MPNGLKSARNDGRRLRYQDIREQIRREIEESRFAPGERLPSDTERATRFSVSRLTGIRALRELESQALVWGNDPAALHDKEQQAGELRRYPERSPHDLIRIDNRQAGPRMTRHLIQAGCRRIVFASRPGAAMLDRLEPGSPGRDVLLDCELIVRHSCGAK